MTRRNLISRSLRFHWRSHLGVVLGAAVGSAALIGALIVGDSVRETLRERALSRVGNADNALASGDRFFTEELGLAFEGAAPREASATLLQLPGTIANSDATARAGNVQVYGVRNYFAFTRPYSIKTNLTAAEKWRSETDLPNDSILLNQALASKLNARIGDTVVLRVHKPTPISRDAFIAPQSDYSAALRLRVNGIVDAEHGGNLSMRTGQLPALNAFVRLPDLAAATGLRGRANLILAGVTRAQEQLSPFRTAWTKIFSHFPWYRSRQQMVPDSPERQIALLNEAFRTKWRVDDTELFIRSLNDTQAEVSTTRIFLDDAVVRAATSTQSVAFRSPQQRVRIPSNMVFVGSASLRQAVEVGRLPLNTLTQNFMKGTGIWVPATSALARAVVGLLGRPNPVPPTTTVPITNATPVLTYLVNLIRSDHGATPYSMVTAAGTPYLPPEMNDDEILVNDWLADDLQVKPGDRIALTYFVADSSAALVERTNSFRVHSVVPMNGIYADRTLMPQFPGIAKAESTHDWDAGFPLVHTIRPKDDAYWKQHRGTPKAFITLAAGQKMWANRFGSLTAIRWPAQGGMSALQVAGAIEKRVMANLDPKDLGFSFQPIREEALRAAEKSQDFGGLFIGFSLFLIVAALILMGLLFQFGIEQRATEIGTLLAVGFTPKQVRRLFLREGVALALVGGLIGSAGGIAYARLMLRGLTTVWKSATNTSALTFHASAETIAAGLSSAVLVAALTIWLVLRKQGRQPARALLAGDWDATTARNAEGRQRLTFLRKMFRAPVVAWTTLGLALATIASAFATHETSNPEYFFSAGSFCLIAGLAFTSWLLRRMVSGGSTEHLSRSSLAVRGAARRKSRSVATVALLACGVFLIVAVGAFRLDANLDAWKRSSGTGGFALIGESTLPIIKDLNTRGGREALGLDEKIMAGVSFVPMRVKEGDDASCLNLNRAQQPRLLGVNPNRLKARFSFATTPDLRAIGANAGEPWQALGFSGFTMTGSIKSPSIGDRTEPAIGDAASIQWALGKRVGDTLVYKDEHGADFDLRLVGALANSILQGPLVVDESLFARRFPSISGYRMFFIDCPSNALPQVSAELTRALQDYGFEVTRAADRLAAFNAVQNTYLNTFQVLGGLGLLLGSAGLGIVVLRNVLERRGELALLLAVGYRHARVQKLVLGEHAALLGLGLFVGILSALVAVLPGLLSPRAEFPVTSLALTLGGVLLFGIVSTWLATRAAVRGNLLQGLRNE